MIPENLKRIMRDYNIWWDQKTLEIPPYHRTLFRRLITYLDKPQIIAIVGLRRVGKTILLRQMIHHLLTSNLEVSANQILYFLFDDLIVQQPEILEELIEYYCKVIAPTTQKKYIFLDEIQKVAHWQDILKRYYDTHPEIKFFISGSASMNIKQSTESLAGRIYDEYLPILTFREFLEMNEIIPPMEPLEMKIESFMEVHDKFITHIPLIEDFFLKYIYKGGFPEILKESDGKIIQKYIKSAIIDHVLLGDIPLVYDVRRKDILYGLLQYCSKETSNIFEINTVAGALGVHFQTVKEYLFYLKEAFLIDFQFNYSVSLAHELRKNKKLHIAHTSITCAMHQYSEETLRSDALLGQLIETIIFQHIKLVAEKIGFWRSPQKDEVDVIIETKPLLPIEVKYRNRIDTNDLKGILKFIGHHQLPLGIVVTKNKIGQENIKGNNILFVPAWLFLFIA